MGGVRGTGDVMRDARLPVMEKKNRGHEIGGLGGVLACTPLEPRRLQN